MPFFIISLIVIVIIGIVVAIIISVNEEKYRELEAEVLRKLMERQ